ncbi:MAG: hypothetical protein S0880_25605 [Actinomycetota bacterium]|nr:hypothetical protein [Actinomycetota bacterium]
MYRSPQSAAGAVVTILRSTGHPLRRAELTERIGVTPASMGAALTKLASRGVVAVEHGVADGVGRPSPNVRLLPASACTLSVCFGSNGAGSVVAHDLVGEMTSVARTPPVDDAYAAMGNVVDVVRHADTDLDRLVGVGVGVGRRVGAAPSDEIVGELRAKLGAVVGEVPVELAEHTKLAAIAAARGRADGTLVLYLHSCRPGQVTGGLAVAGEPFRLLDLGFDVAHMMLRVGGRGCRCGRRGCVAAELYNDEAAPAGNGRRERAPIDPEGLALTVDTLTRLVRPGVVVLAGSLAAHAAPAPQLLAPLRVEGAKPPDAIDAVEVERAPWRHEEGVHLGAGELALREFLVEPSVGAG